MTHSQIKDILAYLQLVDNPNYDPAFSRIVNVPPRSIGDKVRRLHLSRLKGPDAPFLLVRRRDREYREV